MSNEPIVITIIICFFALLIVLAGFATYLVKLLLEERRRDHDRDQ